MENLKQFLSRYSVFVTIAGAILFIFSIAAISSLPSPFNLYPGEATRKYYTPLKIYQFLRLVGILITLVGAYFIAKQKFPKSNSSGIDTLKISSTITDGFASITSSNQRPQTRIIELRQKIVNNKHDYVFTDENSQTTIGLNKILNSLTSKGLRIVNTIETEQQLGEKVMQVIVEK